MLNVSRLYNQTHSYLIRTPCVACQLLTIACFQLFFSLFLSSLQHTILHILGNWRAKKHASDVLYVKRFMEHTWYNVWHQIHEYIQNQWRRNYKWNFVYGQQPFFFEFELSQFAFHFWIVLLAFYDETERI